MCRTILLLGSILLCGCGDPSKNAPMLKLSVERENGSSSGQYRVFHTGVIAQSEDGGGGGFASQTVTIDEIAEDGVTVTVAIFDSDSGKSSKQFLVPYDEEIKVVISEKVTTRARLVSTK